MKKIKTAIIAIKKIKNWPTYFLDYLSLIRKKNITYKFRKGPSLFLRAGTSDRGIMTSIVVSDEHRIENIKLEKNAVIVDIGAQTGIFSIYVSNKAEKIYAYEPEPTNYEYLINNIKINKLKNKIIPFNLAVSNKKEKLKIYYSKENTGGHSSYLKTRKFFTTKTTTLKEIIELNKLKKIDLLKIDTEGAEYKILFGLPQHYFKNIKRIIVEIHEINHETYNKKNLIKYLKKAHYEIEEKEGYLFCTKRN